MIPICTIYICKFLSENFSLWCVMKYWGKYLFYAMSSKAKVMYSNVLRAKYFFPLFFVTIKLRFQSVGSL